jgi:hypothetical protein
MKLYPTKASALNVHHPIAGKPLIEGVDWPYDVFTCRRISDGSFTEDETKAYKPPPEEAKAAAEKPAAAAGIAPGADKPAVPTKPQEIATDSGKPK